eukprot:jgi/Psemu1/306880/fgenesh1_kg.287_\
MPQHIRYWGILFDTVQVIFENILDVAGILHGLVSIEGQNVMYFVRLKDDQFMSITARLLRRIDHFDLELIW